MKKIKEFFQKNKAFQVLLLLSIGVWIGWLLFGGSASQGRPDSEQTEAAAPSQVWTCSMHPQIRKNAPGNCPICGMDLIPLRSGGSSNEAAFPADAMQMSEEAIALANIQTSVVSRKNPVKEILLYGVIAPDERRLQSQTAHTGGRIEKLFVDFTGETVRAGQPLVTLYSPELLTAQQELLEALKLKETQPQLLQAAREKLRLWKLTDGQIAQIETSGIVSPTVDIKSTTSGIVMSRKISEGDYVSSGGVLFEVADLSSVWAMFDAYEVDLAFLKVGDRLDFTVQAVPGKVFTGKISFIDPILDQTTRTARVRVEIPNPNLLLKPEMYANATVTASLQQFNNQIVIPQSAVLWTGKRSIVYVSLTEYDVPVYQLREVELGPSLGNSYVVLDGLEDGELIVSNGVFAIDASAQLEGKRSMMNDESGRVVTGHEGHDMSGSGGNAMRSAPSVTSHEGHNRTGKESQMEHVLLKVEGSCEMCKKRIEKVARGVSGVSSAAWDRKDKVLHLNFDSDKTDLDQISKAIAEAGHDTERDRADDKVYDALPGCCKYRK